MRLIIYTIVLISLIFPLLTSATNLTSFNELGSINSKIKNKKDISEIFILEKILITGNKKTSDKDIMEILPTPGSDSLYRLELKKIKLELLSFPWIKDIEVRRVLPATLHVKIFEYTPFFIWQNKGNFKLLNKDGLIITSIEYHNSKLPLVIGENAPQNISSFFDELKTHPKLINNLIVASNYRGRRWDITLESGIIIKLPENDIRQALVRLTELEKKNNLFDKDIKIIDLRIENRLFITLRKGVKFKFNRDTFNEQNV